MEPFLLIFVAKSDKLVTLLLVVKREPEFHFV